MQEIYQGISHLQEALKGSSKVLLVIDKSFPFLNIKEEVESIKIPYIKFSNFTPNPLYEDVCKGVSLFNAENCDTILTIGGGSSMDVAKCIKLYCKMERDKLYLNQEYKDTGIKLIAIPTTAGTGSESTRYAVIYYEGKKQSVTHDSIIPNVAILEPKVLKTLPLYQKKCTMLDALCQGIESWWSVNSSDQSKLLSKKAVETIMKWWHEYIYDNTDEAAYNIMQAANDAGRAICITQTTAPHAFSYKITSLYDLPHGHAVAICLTEIWDYMLHHIDDCIDNRGPLYLKETFSQIASSMGHNSAEEAVKDLRHILNELEISSPVTIDRLHDLDILSSTVNPIRLRNNPVELNIKSIYSLYGRIIHC